MLRMMMVSGACALIVGCGGGSKSNKPTAVTGGGGGAAVTNTSIASAMTLAKGQRVSVVLPCTGKVYFGPFNFTTDPETVKIVFENKSNSGAQVCGAGNWVDKNDVAVSGDAGTGCAEGPNANKGYIQHEHSPGNGGDPTTPAYFWLMAGDGNQPDGCETSTVSLTME